MTEIPNEDRPAPDISPRRALVLLTVILLVGGLTRFWQIGHKELWLDECISAVAAEGSLAQTAVNVAQNDAHPPLYYLALNATTRLTGRSEAGHRVLSALASTASIALTYLIGAALLSRAAGLLAAGGLALSSFQLYFAQEARLHALVTLLVLGMTYVFIRIVTSRDPSPRALWPWMAGYGLLVAASLYTYYYAFFAVAAHVVVFCVLWLVVRWRSGAGEERWLLTHRRADALWPMWLAAMVLGGVLFVVGWGDVVLDKFGAVKGVESSPYALGGVVAALRRFLTGPAFDRLVPQLRGLEWFSMSLVALLPFAGAACAARTKPGAAWLLALSVLVPFACLAVIPRPHVFEAKHLAFVAPVAYLMLGASWSLPRIRWIAVMVLVLLAALNTGLNWVYFRPDYRKERWADVARELRVRGRRGDVVVVTPRYGAHALGRYYDGPMQVVPANTAEPLVSVAASRPPAVWLVELGSQVAYPSAGIGDWLRAHKQFCEPAPPGRIFRGFSTFPTAVRIRRFVHRPAGTR